MLWYKTGRAEEKTLIIHIHEKVVLNTETRKMPHHFAIMRKWISCHFSSSHNTAGSCKKEKKRQV